MDYIIVRVREKIVGMQLAYTIRLEMGFRDLEG